MKKNFIVLLILTVTIYFTGCSRPDDGGFCSGKEVNDVGLTNNSFAESATVGHKVGNFYAICEDGTTSAIFDEELDVTLTIKKVDGISGDTSFALLKEDDIIYLTTNREFDYETSSSHTVNIEAKKNFLDKADKDFTINVTDDDAPNSAPTVTGVPSNIAVIKDQQNNINLSSITFSDENGDLLTVKFTVSSGTFSSSYGSGSQITLEGTAEVINAILDSALNLKYTSAPGVVGDNAATITVTATDGTDSLASNPTINIDVREVIFDTWEKILGNDKPTTPKVYSKVVNQNNTLRVGTTDEAIFTGTLCFTVIDNNNSYFIYGNQEYSCLEFNTASSDITLESSKLQTASQKAFIKFKVFTTSGLSSSYDGKIDTDFNSSWIDTSSSDYFAIKPLSIVVNQNSFSNPSIAERTYTDAFTFSSSNSGYNQSSSNLQVSSIYSIDGMNGDLNLGEFTFNGTTPVNVDANFSNVGFVDINITDSQWTIIDQADDCIANSISNTINANGKYGCNIFTQIGSNIQFIPDNFRIDNIAFSTVSSDPFSLIKDYDDNGTLNFTVEARGEQNNTMTNFDGALDTDTTDLTITLNLINTALDLESNSSSILKNSFTNGFTNSTIGFNIDKNHRVTREPIDVNVTSFSFDVNLSIGGVDINTSKIETSTSNIYLLYGRINPIDTVSDADPVTSRVYYEVFSKDRALLTTIFGSAPTESVTDVNWWQVPSANSLTVNDFVRSDTSGNANLLTVNVNMDDVSFNAPETKPLKIKVEIDLNENNQQFLYYHPYSDSFIDSFYINFLQTPTKQTQSSDLIKNRDSQTGSTNRLGE